MYKKLRNSISPHTGAIIGWGGMFAAIIIAIIVALATGGEGGRVGYIIAIATAAAFVVFWFVFGRCYECGHVPRPVELYCAGCGAKLTKEGSRKDADPEKDAANLAEVISDRDLTETQASSEEIFDGKVLHVFRDQILLPDGRGAERELIRHVGAVCVIPVTEDGNVIVERQYRYPIAQPVIEIPAGKLDYPGEDRLEAAKRELREETGYTADRWTDIGLYYGAPAFSDEKITIYMAQGLHRGEQELDEDEFIDVFEVPLTKLVKMVVVGEIVDGKTQVAVLKAAQILGARL